MGQQEQQEQQEGEKAFEKRVKSYNIDTDSIIQDMVRRDEERRKAEAEKEKAVKTEGAGVVENEDLEEKIADLKIIDEGADTYEDYGASNDDSGREWEKGAKALVDADYDDYDDSNTLASSDSASSHATRTDIISEDDYDDEMGDSTSRPIEMEDADDLEEGEAFLKVMEKCEDLICIQQAHAKYPRAANMFNFPHFMIIGFQKAATTSLKRYLERHSQIDKPRVKEPNFFPYDCQEKPPEKCSKANTTRYIHSTLHKPRYIEQRGRLACMEASTHIVRAGHNLAPRMAKLMPWLKIIIQFREPISRAASMLIHNKDVNQVGCLMRSQIGHCLLHHSQLTEMQNKNYEPLTYTEAITPWIENFPKEQIHIIQYETLVDPEKEADELLRVKKFLEVDERRPKGGLEVSNARRFSINPEGWKVRKSDYEELVSLVEPDVLSLVDLLYEHELLDDKDGWVNQWRKHWKSNLKTCNGDNVCVMSLS